MEEEGFEQKQSREVADSIDPITQEDPWLSFQKELRDYVDDMFEVGGIDDNQLKAFQRDKQFRRRLQEMRESGEEPPSAQEAFEEWRKLKDDTSYESSTGLHLQVADLRQDAECR